MFPPKHNLRMILVCACMLVFPAWAGSSKSYSEDRVEPLLHYSVGVRYEHTLQDRRNIIEDEDVLINGVSAGCAVWMNYADFAGVKCDVRFGLYL